MTQRIIVGGYVAVFFVVILFLIKTVGRRTGASPVIGHNSCENPLMAFAERAVLASYFLIILNALFYTFDFRPSFLFEEFRFPGKKFIGIAGIFLAGISLAFLFTAQFQMRDSWRIGIDDRRDTEMVNGGLFGFFRHPIYFFAIAAGASLFMIFPQVLSFAAFILLYVSLSFQARIEEEFLLRKWGDAYKKFMRARKRWF